MSSDQLISSLSTTMNDMGAEDKLAEMCVVFVWKMVMKESWTKSIDIQKEFGTLVTTVDFFGWVLRDS